MVNKSIKRNIAAHNRIAHKYEVQHPEIYNDIEQRRLHEQLVEAVFLIQTDSKEKCALDYGCGTGNVTKHLIELGLQVFSADLSKKFLSTIKRKFSATGKSQVLEVNGEDLSNVNDNTFDLIATYSVLHHVPDYLRIIEEFVRVTKPSGTIYIDHEVNENHWNQPQKLREFYKKAWKNPKKSSARYIKPVNYINKIKSILNPRYQEEGDIHVWPDDHIEWDKIIKTLKNKNCDILNIKDYLLYNKEYVAGVWEKYHDKTSDMRLIIAKKL